MRAKTAKSLADALLAARRIEQALQGCDLSRFREDWEKQGAVLYQFLIVGEAISRIREEEPPLLEQIAGAKAAIAFRHLVAHGYDAVDPERVFQTAEIHLPGLIERLEVLAAQAEREGLSKPRPKAGSNWDAGA